MNLQKESVMMRRLSLGQGQ